jgi:hypothetical protein
MVGLRAGRRGASKPHGRQRNHGAPQINHPASRRTLTTVAAVFTCSHCNAVPERVVEGKATIAVVRHKLGCPTLVAQTRTRWFGQALSS